MAEGGLAHRLLAVPADATERAAANAGTPAVTGYLVRRLLATIPLLWAVATITFVLMHAVPGGPFERDKPLPAATVANLERKYGLDDPPLERYLRFLGGLAQGDLGVSFTRNRPVTEVLSERAAPTVQLGLCAFAFAAGGGLALGIVSALHARRWPDHAGLALATVGGGIPNFVVAAVLVQVFAVKLGWFDVLGWELGNPEKMVLPTVALGLLPLAFIARITRAALLETMVQDYVRTARAKGLDERRVVVGHALRNAAVPILTVLGPILAALVTGSFIVERFFAIPGIGTAFVESVAQRDYGMIMGTTLLYAAVVALLNLAVDVAYAVADPRIRYDR